MIADTDLDRIIATWVADGPERAPRRYVDAALAQIATTAQRRRPIVRRRIGLASSTSRRSVLAVSIAIVLLAIIGLADGLGSGLIRPSPPPPPPPVTSDVTLRPITISDWSARVSIPTTWQLVGDPDGFSESRRFRGEDPEGDLTVSHESPYQVTICDAACREVALPRPIPYSAATLLDGLKDGVASIAGDDAWSDLGPRVLPELEGGVRLDTDKRDADGRTWHTVYIVGLRDRNAVAISWRQPAEAFDRALLDAVLSRLELPSAPVYTDGDLIPSTETGADFTIPLPGFWITGDQPEVDGKPLDGVLDFGPDRVTVSVGSADGTFGWCEGACRERRGVSSLDALEAAVRETRELGPAADATLGGERARAFAAVRDPGRRYVIAMHAGRPVAIRIDPGDWDIADGVTDQMIKEFAFVDPPPPAPAEQVLRALDGHVEFGLPSNWRPVMGVPDAFSRNDGHLRMSVRVGAKDGSIDTCSQPAAPWELCRRVKVTSVDELAEAVRPAPIKDHGVGPPSGRTKRGMLGGEPSVVIRIQAYEYPAKSGQEVVYVAAFHAGRPYLIRIHTTANQVMDLGAIIAGFRFVD